MFFYAPFWYGIKFCDTHLKRNILQIQMHLVKNKKYIRENALHRNADFCISCYLIVCF